MMRRKSRSLRTNNWRSVEGFGCFKSVSFPFRPPTCCNLLFGKCFQCPLPAPVESFCGLLKLMPRPWRSVQHTQNSGARDPALPVHTQNLLQLFGVTHRPLQGSLLRRDLAQLHFWILLSNNLDAAIR